MFYFFDIGQSRNVPTNLTNVPQYKISRKTVHWEPSFSADGQTESDMTKLRTTVQLSNKQNSYLYVNTNVRSANLYRFTQH